MDVPHDMTDDDRRPERAESALQERQRKEDAETVRVRGPQRPADTLPTHEPPTPAAGRPVSPVVVRASPAFKAAPFVARPSKVETPAEQSVNTDGHSDEVKAE